MVNTPKSFFQKLVNNGDLKFNRKLGIYLVCLLFSCLLWLLLTLSENYETDIIFPVTYSGIPANKVVTNRLPENISAKVNAGGFSLLWYKIKGGGETLKIEIPPSRLREINGTYYTLPNYRLEKISSQLGNKIKILKISPDTIYISYAEKLKRKLPVKTDLTYTLQKQHGFYDSIKTEPEFVNVSGPKHIVEKMNYAETEKIILKDVSNKQILNIGFKKSGNYESVVFSPEKIKLIVPVEKYTEGSKEIQVTVKNITKSNKVKIYPEKVKVTYMVGLSKYEQVESSMFTVGFNFKNIPKGKGNKIKVELLNAPEFVNSVKIEPASVEYIIQK